MVRILLAASALLLTGTGVRAQSLDGIWKSQGYGYIFEIRGASMNAFEVTATTCLPGFPAQRAAESAAAAGHEAVFKTTDGDVFFIRGGGAADHKLMHNDGSASDIRIDRVSAMPRVCDKPTADTPAGNFEVFARTWAEHYISFDLKHADWEKTVAANRPKVTDQTTPAQLFEIFAGMIRPFDDAHTFISSSGIRRDFAGFRPGSARAEGDQRKTLLRVTEQAYLKGGLQDFCNGKVQFGHLDQSIGYLRILSFYGYAKGARGFAPSLLALESALDTILSDPALKGLVIDVRINDGGADPLGLAIASRLAANEYLAYTKVARADPTDRNKWTPGDPSLVRPSARPGFRGPVVELIGPLTISAGETFTQALMGRSPHITRIGDNTQGVFSDVLGRHLPNGWAFGLPNEVFRTPRGTAFDGPGIPPDIAVPVFASADVAAGRDPGMAKALEILRNLPRTPAR